MQVAEPNRLVLVWCCPDSLGHPCLLQRPKDQGFGWPFAIFWSQNISFSVPNNYFPNAYQINQKHNSFSEIYIFFPVAKVILANYKKKYQHEYDGRHL
jgi:hypothetical protein